jgi:hypothetical protein
MSLVVAAAFLVYLWHYLIARLLFDEFLGGLSHSRGGVLVALICAGLAGYWIGRRRRRRVT